MHLHRTEVVKMIGYQLCNNLLVVSGCIQNCFYYSTYNKGKMIKWKTPEFHGVKPSFKFSSFIFHVANTYCNGRSSKGQAKQHQ